MPLLTLAVDPGTSLTKCIYQIDGEPPKLLTLPPESVELASDFESTIEEQCKDANIYGSASPEDLIWYKLKQRGNIFVVGSLARKYQQGIDIKRLKYESAEIKIIGIIGTIAQREHLEAFTLDIAMLLPYGEYKDGEKLKQKVASALAGSKGFYWHGAKSVKASLDQWLCYPEGSGRMFRYIEEVGQTTFASQNIAVLMLGHRNGSILKLIQGKDADDSESSDKYGFHRFLDYVLEQKSGYEPDDFLDAIIVNRPDKKPSEYAIDARKVAELRNRKEENIEQEKLELEAAIESAKLRYIRSLKNWIQAKTRSCELDKVLFCGGACLFFRDVLEEFSVADVEFDIAGVSGEKIDPYRDELVDELSQALNLTDRQKQDIGYRLVDVYSLFKDFRPSHEQIERQETEAEAMHA